MPISLSSLFEVCAFCSYIILYTYVYLSIYLSIYIYTSLSMYIYIYVCMYVGKEVRKIRL